ncbi:hypothetical protein [Senegalia sp. (in: firmicutes)]|uniref:hypothetical protein n=1 Tax=Senegalia sp. (in: firmicutes) TaxID=1924098 RepID=UPI003F947A80
MENCFAYKIGRCKALKIRKCGGIECGFYKTKEQLKIDEEEVIKRIKSLDKEKQEHITEKYYGTHLEV